MLEPVAPSRLHHARPLAARTPIPGAASEPAGPVEDAVALSAPGQAPAPPAPAAGPAGAQTASRVAFSQVPGPAGVAGGSAILRALPSLRGEVAPGELERLRVDAKKLVSGFEGDATRLYSTSGFASREELMKAVEASTPGARQAARLLLEENLEVGMATRDSVRDQVVRDGFLNFRISANSESMTREREVVEANYAGMEVDQYAGLHGDLKPKYGYLSPKPDSGLSAPLGVRNYGADRFVFDLDRVRDRMTFTIGDSANRHVAFTAGFDTPATTWDQRFMPWSRRELAAPAMAAGVDGSKLGLAMNVWSESRRSVEEEWPSLKHLIQLTESPDPETPVEWTSMETGVFPPAGSLEKYQLAWDASLDYVEVQLWGPLDLDDVKAFEFTTQPPEGEFLKELVARGIEIRDGRQNPPRVWP